MLLLTVHDASVQDGTTAMYANMPSIRMALGPKAMPDAQGRPTFYLIPRSAMTLRGLLLVITDEFFGLVDLFSADEILIVILG